LLKIPEMTGNYLGIVILYGVFFDSFWIVWVIMTILAAAALALLLGSYFWLKKKSKINLI
jgi:uncharacterized membrane protein YhfC